MIRTCQNFAFIFYGNIKNTILLTMPNPPYGWSDIDIAAEIFQGLSKISRNCQLCRFINQISLRYLLT